MASRSGLGLRFGRAFIVATLCGLAVFMLLRSVGDAAIDYYIESSNYVQRHTDARIQELQDYVAKHDLATTDAAMLRAWCSQQPLVLMEVYRGDKLVFNSSHPEPEDLSGGDIDARYYDWYSYYEVEFSDGIANLLVSSNDVYQLRMWATAAMAALAFLVFFLVFLIEVRRVARYVRLLSTQIKAMEGGELDQPVTVKEGDELGTLAASLDSMRMSFLSQREAEERSFQANQQLVTGLSHDLRTPLTKLTLYTEIARAGKYEDEEGLQKLLTRIDEFAGQIKDLADDILHHSLAATEPPKSVHDAGFEDAVGAEVEKMAEYLREQGFKVEAPSTLPATKVEVCDEHVRRVLDNVASNAVKYGDRATAVSIAALQEEGRVGILVRNAVAANPVSNESTGLGQANMAALMEKMGGSCSFREEDGLFESALWFRSA